MQVETAGMRLSESEGKLDVHTHSSFRTTSKSWQYSDHMENVDGYLMKYTNLVTGWQYRFFVLNNEAGLLEYFMNEQLRHQKPRGTLPLGGAVISPSDEDSHTFTVNAISGEQYKLRAADAKERQHWVSRLQICTQHHTEAMGKTNPPLKTRSLSAASQGSSSSPASQRKISHNTGSLLGLSQFHRGSSTYSSKRSVLRDHLVEAREMMTQAQDQHRDLVQCIEGLPASHNPSPLDQDLLLLKATSLATMTCLSDCLHILQLQQVARHRVPLGEKQQICIVQFCVQTLTPGLWLRMRTSGQLGGDRTPAVLVVTEAAAGLLPLHVGSGDMSSFEQGSVCPAGPTIEWLEPKLPDGLKNGGTLASITKDSSKTQDTAVEPAEMDSCDIAGEQEDIDAEEEQEDSFPAEEEDLGAVEEERSVILHLLSQLKLGMDLTRVVLPTFILEKRSLLEMYADFMSHPDLFVAITDGTSPMDRMIRFVEYYLTSFHEGRKGAIAKKPYNPIIGETFHCSWRVPKTAVSQGSVQKEGSSASDCYHVRFVAEQVSHHPPVSGFYAECQERQMCVNTHVWTKSKFMGMSIGVSMIGEGNLHLLEHGEEYTFTLPSAYARSILTVPWVELGGKVNVNCAKTGYSAAITFQTKPFYGGKLHRVNAEVKHNPTNSVVCRVQGEWNGVLEFTYSNGETRIIDVLRLPITRKRVRPKEQQGPYESRRLWQHVTESLLQKDMEKATEHKRFLEERQRKEERHRTETETAWRTKYFERKGEGWVYHKPLWKSVPAQSSSPAALQSNP